jgi:hypothetical protein
MAILKYIGGFPLFSSEKEARLYGETLGIYHGTHVHKFKVGPNNYRTGYMPASSHDELHRLLKRDIKEHTSSESINYLPDSDDMYVEGY